MFGLEALQASAEVVSQGVSTGQAVTWTAVAMAAVSNIAAWLTIIVGGRRRKAQSQNQALEQKTLGVPLPGNGLGTLLKDHGEKLVKHDTEIKTICEQMKEWRDENREDHKQLFAKIDGIGK